MPARPVMNAFEQFPTVFVAVQPARQGQRFGFRKIMKFDAFADIKWRRARIADQVRRRSDSKQAKRQSFQLFVFGAEVVKRTNGREKFVGGKRQAEQGVNFIKKNYRRGTVLQIARQDDFANGPHPSLYWAEFLVCAPEFD